MPKKRQKIDIKDRDSWTAIIVRVTRPRSLVQDVREILSNQSDESDVELEPLFLSQFLGTKGHKDSTEKPMSHSLSVYPSVGWIFGRGCMAF